ncbi:MAG: tRNA 5-methoxyuridine(34)/uridine 5-oxyacetic acid(34) synthase CmoB [Gammaproteobacteria bacterium]|nr:tRNA 5-methoxyuridine(34)/uridine 5-oxyacetic acid(34) synthase CmoB [Gammaproteobacteria bacterium]
MENEGLTRWAQILSAQLDAIFHHNPHGDLPRWLATLEALPPVSADIVDLNNGTILAASRTPLEEESRARLASLLQQLHPWRKGPYRLHGVDIDSEWRSDWKWSRLAGAIRPLTGRRILDVGCGNGYHCWRAAGAGAKLVIGIDPTQLYLAQFLAVRHFLGDHWPVHLLPVGIEQIPTELRAFDTVFSMGVLYHRRSPIDHLLELSGCLKPGGELVLETLVIEGGKQEVLVPRGRYAKMRNVWFIPTPEALIGWLKRCGFDEIRVVDISRTTTAEQRSTAWMRFESLSRFLCPDDPLHTLEGHPAPIRAILTATAN